ncbi:hypothetical protein SBRCBS47491_006601 [Sporothrix bragantina]|uniref:THIF-type NAD/FAD binding fold domain-containing protein n=1 Tax=Sporothrix bragantina TaxID=671064 RepID=A0ABP0C6M9_9PEZI
MIESTTLADAQVVVIGLNALTTAIIQDLLAFGAQHITIVTDAETEAHSSIRNDSGVSIMHTTVQDLLERDDGTALLRDSNLVLAANSPRPVELALSHLRDKEVPERPLIIMRGKENACKMRCQYRALHLSSSQVATFVALEDELLPWTDAKRDLVAATVEELVPSDDDNNFAAYLAAARAFLGDYDKHDAWPTAENYDRVAATVPNAFRSAQQEQFLRQLCQGGLAAPSWSIRLLARVVALDARRLLTGDAQPHNNTELQDVIRIATERRGVCV